MRNGRTLGTQAANVAEQVTRREPDSEFLLNEYINSLNMERTRDKSRRRTIPLEIIVFQKAQNTNIYAKLRIARMLFH